MGIDCRAECSLMPVFLPPHPAQAGDRLRSTERMPSGSGRRLGYHTHFCSSKVGSMSKPLLLLLIAPLLLAQTPAVTGRWFATVDLYGTPINISLELNQHGDKLTGAFGGDKLEGTLAANSIHFLAKDEHGGTAELTGALEAGAISGNIVFVDADDKEHPTTHPFAATLAPQRRAGTPQRHDFTPSVFHRQFSAANKPVLTVFPGFRVPALGRRWDERECYCPCAVSVAPIHP
jgi:hypothetical protein